MTKNVWIGELYVEPELFADEANKTIGEPIVGKNFETLVANRRRVTSRMTEAGQRALARAKKYLEEYVGMPIKLVWDIHCGCRMCPCSPGFKVIVEHDTNYRSQDDCRFDLWIGKGAKQIRVKEPKHGYLLSEIRRRE